MNRKITYSVVIPTLNEDRLLPNLLNQFSSELKDKYGIEIIVSDGGSSDNTIKIALEYADIVINDCPIKENIAKGRNKGAKVSNGEILVFLNGDIRVNDISNFFRILETKFKDSEFIAMTAKVKIFPEEEILSDKIFQYCYNKYFKLLNTVGIGMGRGECQIVKKQFFNIEGGYNEDLAAGEDFDLFRRLMKRGIVVFNEDLTVFESPRRFRKYGYMKVTSTWIKNGLSVFIKNKSLSKEWEEVR